MENRPVVVLERWKTAEADKKPVVFECPWRKHAADSVTLVSAATAAIQRGRLVCGRGGRAPGGTELHAGSLEDYMADLGAVFSEATGANRAARVYWSNKGTRLVNDVPAEIMAQPNLWSDVQFTD